MKQQNKINTLHRLKLTVPRCRVLSPESRPYFTKCKARKHTTSGSRRRVAAPSASLHDPIEAAQPRSPDPGLINADFRPTQLEQRTFDTWDMAALWIGLVVSITTWYLAGGLVEMGMAWWQGILTILAGNTITLVLMVLNGHPGCKYGVPFPVLARASFGIRGANLPSLLRALVACGWFGIQTWVGAAAIHQMVAVLSGGAALGGHIAWLGISSSELACFLLFWAVQAGIIARGIESIRLVEKYSAPVLIGLSAALLLWAVRAAGGFGPMLSAPSQFGPGMPQAGRFWHAFWPALTANVGYWATLSLNIPDFTRYAKSQRAQAVGQALGLPLSMAAFAFVGLAVASATVVIYGAPVTDPVQLVSRLPGAAPACLALLGLVLATLSTNIAANVVAPANALVNLAPGRVSFVSGGLLASLLGALVMPWNLVRSTQGFIYTWLIGYSALLGPIGGVLAADYFVIRRRQLSIDGLFSSSPSGPYYYVGGWNPAAIWALAVGAAPSLPGFLSAVRLVQGVAPVWQAVYSFSWFCGFASAAAVYCLFMLTGRMPVGRPADLEA